MTTSYEKFAQQQRQLNPNITDQEIEKLWSEQPISKRIAGGLESAIVSPAKAAAAVGPTLKSAISSPNPWESSKLKADVRAENLWGEGKRQEKLEETTKDKGPSTPEPVSAAAEETAPSLVQQSQADISQIQSQEKPPTRDEAKESADRQIILLNRLAQLKYNNPKDQQAVQAERDRAEELYDKARSRNEWLEVAQTLAAAMAQLGAAQAGAAQGVAVRAAPIAMTDYGARTARSERALERRLRNIEQDEASRERAAKEETGAKEFNIRMQLEQEKLRERQAEKAAQAGKETAEDRQLRSLQASDLKTQLQQKQKELESASQLANQLAMEKDFSSKSLKKLEEKTPGLLAKAGVDAADLAQIEQEATERGYIWDTVDEKKKAQLVKERILDKKREEINNLRSALDSVIRGRQAQPAAATIPAAQPATSGMVKMRAPDGRVGEIPAGQVQAAEAKGFTRVQ